MASSSFGTVSQEFVFSNKYERDGDTKTEKLPLLGSCRLVVAVYGALVLCTSFASQASMTSAMVCMIKEDNNGNNNNSSSSNNNNNITYRYDQLHSINTNIRQTNYTDIGGQARPVSSYNANVSNAETEGLAGSLLFLAVSWKFTWDSQTQGLVVSSFFFGYFVMQIPSGIIVTKWGPKGSIVFSLIATGLLHILSIPTAKWSLTTLYFVRVLAGMCSSFLFPGSYALLVNWSARHETSVMFSLGGVGIQLGNSFIFLVSLLGCQLNFQGGWPFVFYVIGTVQILVGVVTIFCMTSFPASNRFIGKKEKDYIAKHSTHKETRVNIPYGKILSSLPVWAFLTGQFAMEYTFYTIVTQGPLFLRDILKLLPWEINLVSSLPYIVSLPAGLLAGYFSDKMMSKGIFTTTATRKFNETMCKLLTGITLSVLTFLPEREFVGAFCLIVVGAVGLQYVYIGCMSCPGDLSPPHAGFLAGLSQAVTTWVSFVIPIVTAELTKEKTKGGWRIIFFTAVGLLVFCLLFFLLFGSGKLQPWAISDSEREPLTIKADVKVDDKARKEPLYLSTSTTTTFYADE